MRAKLSVMILLSCAGALSAQDEGTDPQQPAMTLKESLAEFEPVEGTVELRGIARLELPEGWVFLAEGHGQSFLRQLGNRVGNEVLGVAVPAGFQDDGTFAVYSHSEEGHVDDSETPDYDELLSDMKESSKAQSEERKKAGLGGVELLGWAEAPHYDKVQHKLYWAERLQFEGEDGETLNYNVRILGRTGLLVVQGVGGIEQLAEVAASSKTLLGVTEFVDGKRYDDFDPAYDKLAAYGIGGLIAGKLALKAGLFAKLLLMLKVLWKPIAIGVAFIGGAIFKVLGGKKRAREAAERRERSEARQNRAEA
ncbi:MAG: DUF2167 domain-containing protein [Planctomycetes bacterium]|nr:DUF2167 domain-containing protein [Planctomycetota bacterium]